MPIPIGAASKNAVRSASRAASRWAVSRPPTAEPTQRAIASTSARSSSPKGRGRGAWPTAESVPAQRPPTNTGAPR